MTITFFPAPASIPVAVASARALTIARGDPRKAPAEASPSAFAQAFTSTVPRFTIPSFPPPPVMPVAKAAALASAPAAGGPKVTVEEPLCLAVASAFTWTVPPRSFRIRLSPSPAAMPSALAVAAAWPFELAVPPKT